MTSRERARSARSPRYSLMRPNVFVASPANNLRHWRTAVSLASYPAYVGYLASINWFPSPQPNSMTDCTPRVATKALITSALNAANFPYEPTPELPSALYRFSQYSREPGNGFAGWPAADNLR